LRKLERKLRSSLNEIMGQSSACAAIALWDFPSNATRAAEAPTSIAPVEAVARDASAKSAVDVVPPLVTEIEGDPGVELETCKRGWLPLSQRV
jgi:hypothetical protein